MSITKLRNSTAIDSALAIAAVNAALKTPDAKDVGDNQTHANKPVQDATQKVELTANSVTKYLQGVAAGSCGEIEALINDLSSLREKLVAEGSRIEQDIVQFADLNHSVIRLTEVVADGVTHVKAPSISPEHAG